MHLYMIRHGQSYINLPDYAFGNSDEPLTQLGRRQAAALREWLPKTLPKVDAIYCSTLSRAVQTAQPLAQAYGVAIHFEHRLREIGCNRMDHTPLPDNNLPQYADYWSSERPFASITPRIEDGESLMNFRSRVGSLIEELLVKHREQIVLVVCHSRVIEIAFDHIFNIGPWRRCEIEVYNTAITYFEYVDLPNRETWRLHFHNQVEHLAQLEQESS
ncbi:MAG: histidine phosphatase family protein [Ardenticatenaceae bacterium]